MKDSTADNLIDDTSTADTSRPFSLFTPRDQQLDPNLQLPDPRVPSFVPRTSSPFSHHRSPTIPGNHEPHTVQVPNPAGSKGDLAVNYNKSASVAPPAVPTWTSPVSDQHRAIPAAESKNRSGSFTCAPRDITTNTTSLDLSRPLETGGFTSTRNKRPSDVSTPVASTDQPTKRPRVKPRLRYNLDALTFNGSALEPSSPLFFSNTRRQRPLLPTRFSSSEAAASMLSKARLEESHVKTVSLARGTVTAPAHGSFFSGSTPNSMTRGNLDRSSTAGSNSSDGLGIHNSKSFGPNAGHPLNSIGIIELFEQDERPTFVVDLSDSTNYGPGQVSTLFANASLRSCEGLYESITGRQDESPAAPGSFIEFKTWLLSASINGESLNVCLPAFSYANIFWSCTTLRKKLRVISGSFATPPGSRIGVAPSAPSQTIGSASAGPTSAPMMDVEPSDYFGSATQPPASAGPKPIPGASIPTSTAVTSTPPILERRISIVDEGSDLDPLLSPLKYVTKRTAHMNPAASALTNVNWFNSHIAITPVATPSFDWTRLPVTDAMPPHIQFARSIDWGSTSLGPIDTWGPDLRQMCNLIMASPHPAAMYWGDDLVAIYNEAYIMLAGLKHPALMGQNYSVAWAEIWDDVKDVFANARLTGEATMKDDDGLFIKRSNYLEETYFSWSIIPMVGGDGTVMGLYNPAFEKTRRKIAERRMLTLREIGERTASARDVKGFWAQVMGAFDYNLYDSPFMLLYSVFDEVDSDASSMHSNSTFAAKPCRLEGALGVPEGHPCAPEHLELRNGTEGFTPVFREVMNTDKPACIEVGTGELPESLIRGLEWRGFGDPCTSVVVCPIHPTTGEAVLGFLVLGVNPRRPYDDDYSLFIQLLSRQLATSLASVVLFEEEIRRGQKAAKLAALDRIELSQQLAARTQEAIESETKFTRMAEFAPVGMFIASSNGNITFANDSWYEISRVPRGQGTADKWIQAVKEEDQQLVEKMWQTLVVDTKPVSFEFRFKAPWQDRRGDRGETWVLFSSYPERDQEGRLKSVFGSITNISEQKWAEGIQTRKMEEAVELKRQQENFIDITSHEMRNPLSAILQCSDEISGSLTQFKNTGSKTLPDELIANCLDAAQTISLCSQHQKRIVDDILTLSKLDSQLLLVTPVDAQPLTVVQRALKMHEGELQAADIQMKFVVDQTFRDMNLDWVRFDPSRVLQVLINLTTNAIKFTTTESKRTITVTIAASNQRPSEMECAPVKYFATRSKKHSMEDKDWGDGERVFIHFSVQDTGRGLSPEEKKLLFMRFSQASPRTHVQYGGSGLGLFISRELTELQGGEIGVESEAGKGSIFAFYVAARRSTAPADDTGINLMHRASDAKGKKDITTMASKDDKQGQAAAPAVPIQKRVLIVEDNLVNQRVLQKQLKALGTEVHLANHGGEALEKLLQSTYCSEGGTLQLGVVLMDQEMPVMDGLTCTRRIRELEREGKIRVHVPIIAVTANARQEQIQTAIDAGMDDVVSKPFRIPDLVPKIEELMGMYPMPDGPSDGSK
jgi:PAS domain S-box-containing protein